MPSESMENEDIMRQVSRTVRVSHASNEEVSQYRNTEGALLQKLNVHSVRTHNVPGIGQTKIYKA